MIDHSGGPGNDHFYSNFEYAFFGITYVYRNEWSNRAEMVQRYFPRRPRIIHRLE